jgi:glycosyltransferase involved in cell wall biosynthesis
MSDGVRGADPPRTRPDPVDVLLVGQTPPPVHGQAMAIARLVDAPFDRVRIRHVPMDFSSAMDDVGRFRIGKMARLARLIWRVLRLRFTTGLRILYYPPAGPALVPVLRDLVFLNVVRPFFPTLVLDLHAGGLAGMEDRLPAPLRTLFRRAYHDAALVIEKYPAEPGSNPLSPRRRCVVPYGITDEFPRFQVAGGRSAAGFTVLYVGLVSEAKGVWTLLDAIALLDRGVEARAIVVGEFVSEQARAAWTERVRSRGIKDRVRHTGRLVGDDKWRELRCADVFCFPTHYENEAMPIAIIEAMQFGLPVVGTDWRGIPHIVQDGVNGFVVPPHDPAAVANRLARLASDAALRQAMGTKSREIFLERHTVDVYLAAMERALVSVADRT